jgi:uncharacterized protein (DUF362 family)
MSKSIVSIVKYEKPLESLRNAVELSQGLDELPSQARVVIKPNIVYWTRATNFPKWGVITTSRVIEDIVVLLKEWGVDDITVVEGMVTMDPKDKETPAHAFETLGYGTLKKRYGVKCFNVFERPFEKVDLGDGVELSFNADILHSDFVVDLPVMKTHNQTVVSLGTKNLKGTLDIPSRKKCHSVDLEKDLNFMVARIADVMPPMLTLLDGIYTTERGPNFDGRIRRSNLLIASADILSADMVGSKVLGIDPKQVPHLVHVAHNRSRPLDLSDVEVVGERIEDVASLHEYDFLYSETEDSCVPVPLAKQGIKGLFYRKYDSSLCTYCSGLNGVILTAIRYAWKGEPWDNVEVLTGKIMKPTPGMKRTILIGKCMYQAHRENPDIQEMIAVKGCPPKPEEIPKAFHDAGIDIDSALFASIDTLPAFFLSRYEGKPEFDESFFKIR